MPTDPLIGARVAQRYEIRTFAADEALGRLYDAWDTEAARPVHIKVLSPEFAADSSRFRRFGREITSTFMVSHPHTVEVLDFGESDGQLFLVLERLVARPLGRDMARGPLEPTRVAAIVAQAAAAIGAAHQEGIVHRNLCPDTLMLLDHTVGGDIVKVRDFGLSKLEADENTQGGLTTANERLGVAAYTAPEYLKSGDYHMKGDIYALGAVAWHALVGRPPFEGDVAAVLARAIQAPPARVSTLRADVPDWLDALVADMVAADPNDRPGAYKIVRRIEAGLGAAMPTPTALALDAAGVPIAAPASGAGADRRWLWLAAVTLAALALVIGLSVLVIGVLLSILLLQQAA